MKNSKDNKKPLSETSLFDPYEVRKRNRAHTNPEKKKLLTDQLERYSGSKKSDFNDLILLTNFSSHLKMFHDQYGDKFTKGSGYSVSHSKKLGISMMNFSIGAPMAAMAMECLSVLDLKTVLFLGIAGGLHRDVKVGDYVLPVAAIRGEGASKHFMPPEAPALPSFNVHTLVAETLADHNKYQKTWSGVIHTTDYRNWEFDEAFKRDLYKQRVFAIEMETSALFVVGYSCKVPIGALLLVSDLPLKKAKTSKEAKIVKDKFYQEHLELGVAALLKIKKQDREDLRHHSFYLD